MHNVLKSTEDIINDDFERLKLSDEPSPRNFTWAPIYNNPNMAPPEHEKKPFHPSNQYLKATHSNSQPSYPMSQSSHTLDYSTSQASYDTISNSSFEGGNESVGPTILGEQRHMQNQPQYHQQQVQQPLARERTSPEMPGALPIIRVTTTNPCDYDFQEKDLMSLFGHCGKIIKIVTVQPKTAFIMFDGMSGALTAQKMMNKYYIQSLNTSLAVSLCQGVEGDNKSAKENQSINANNAPKVQRSQSEAVKDSNFMSKNLNRAVYTFGQETPFLPNTTTKFTCKYEVQIENEKEFRVAQKIIGSRGYNMKRIIEICQAHLQSKNIPFKNDFLKLRLRGRGSGFKEGPDQRESNEPIHLCVSSRYSEVFELACKLVEDLLNYVYNEYETFCRVIGRKGKFPLQIKKSETYCGNGNEPMLSGSPLNSSINSGNEPENNPSYGKFSQPEINMNMKENFTPNQMPMQANYGGKGQQQPEKAFRQFGQDRTDFEQFNNNIQMKQNMNRAGEMGNTFPRYY